MIKYSKRLNSGWRQAQVRMGKIILVLLSEIDEHVLEVLRQSLEQTFHRIVETRAKIRSLDYTYNSSRNQYISPRLLSRLRHIKKDCHDKILGIVDVDLYSPEFDFVFGEAEISSGVATVSFYRLRPERCGLRPDIKVFEERAVKEAVHELGHLYHLDHCTNPKCVMNFSTSLVDINIKGKTFCSKCQQKLRKDIDSWRAKALAFGVWEIVAFCKKVVIFQF